MTQQDKALKSSIAMANMKIGDVTLPRVNLQGLDHVGRLLDERIKLRSVKKRKK